MTTEPVPDCSTRIPTYLSLSVRSRPASVFVHDRETHGISKTGTRTEDQHEYDARISKSISGFHWQMDAKDSLFAEGAALSPRGIAPPSRGHLAANADQNSPQSRIHRIGWTARDKNEDNLGRVLTNKAGNEHHCTS